jgi:hypothetical protein
MRRSPQLQEEGTASGVGARRKDLQKLEVTLSGIGGGASLGKQRMIRGRAEVCVSVAIS